MPQVCCNLYLSQLWALSGRHCVSWLMWSPASGDSLGKKGLQVRLMLLWENMVFLDNTDIQGASFYSLEALTIKMLCFIQSYIKSSLAEATGRFRVWGTSVPCVCSSPLRRWGGNEPELPRAEPALIPLPREVIAVYNTWLMSLVVQVRSQGLVGCSIDLLGHLWGRKTEM